MMLNFLVLYIYGLSSMFMLCSVVAYHARSTILVPHIKYTRMLRRRMGSYHLSKLDEKDVVSDQEKEPSAFDQVASKGLAGILAIACAESIFWALGVPLATLWVKYTTGEWIDLATSEGQLQAAGFTFGYGGFATVILQYRVTLFAIPLVPVMEKLIVEPGKKFFGDSFGQKRI